MYEIEVCYKIIFEAMLEKPVLKSIAEKINEYTGAKVIFVSGIGKILAYSHTCEQDGRDVYKRQGWTGRWCICCIPSAWQSSQAGTG